MSAGVLTRWELFPKHRFEKYFKELLDYLKTKLNPEHNDGEYIYWRCYSHGAPVVNGRVSLDASPFPHIEEFCAERGLDRRELVEMIEEYLEYGVFCECDILNRSRINPDYQKLKTLKFQTGRRPKKEASL